MGTKYNIGDKVKIKRGQHKGKIGVIESLADFRLYGRRTFIVNCNNWKEAFVSYELELLSPAKSEVLEKAINDKKNETHNFMSSKVVLLFDSDTFKKLDSKTVQEIKQNATKINIDGTVLKNRYGDVNVKEKVLYLSLKEAQKMYKAGGYNKEFALKLFTEDELNPKPRFPHTWEEYCDNFYDNEKYPHYYPNFAHGFKKEDYDALIAYGRLIRLRRAWVGDWNPNWADLGQVKYCIKWNYSKLDVLTNKSICQPMNFPTEKMADEFLKCFGDLLEKAKGLY